MPAPYLLDTNILLAATIAPDRLPIVVTPRRGEWVSYHVWAVH